MVTKVLVLALPKQNIQSICEESFVSESVFFATDIESAQFFMQQKKPDIFISAIQFFNNHELSSFSKCKTILYSDDPIDAVKAFELGVRDFVLGPLNVDKIKLAVSKIKTVQQNEDDLKRTFEARLAKLEGKISRPTKTLVIKEVKRIRVFDQDRIKYVKGAGGNYVEIHFDDEPKLIHRATLGSIEEVLNKEHFRRIHRSTIINLRYLQEVSSQRSGAYTVKLKGGTELAVPRGKKGLLEDIL